MKRNRHSPNEKAKIVLETFRGEKTLSEIAAENNIHPNLLSKWKKTTITGLSTLYYKSRFSLEEYLKINRFIDEIYTAYPFFGYRRIKVWLAGHYGISLDPKTVLKHMQEMGIRAIYPRPSLSRTDKENKIYPYLLKDVEILRSNQVWSIDITYIPIRSSFLYLPAIIDWYSRYVISWEIDDTLDIGFVLETCQNALSEFSPEIMNSEQGLQNQYGSLRTGL